MSRLAALLAAAVLAAVLAACGEKEDRTGPGEARPVKVVLDYFPNADHVGLYQALADGTFSKAGLAVDVETPSDPAAPLKLLAAGKVDLAISYEPELLLARDRGLDVVSVAAIVQKPLTSIMSLPSERIRTPRDLAGKKVGTAGIPYQSAYLKTILARAGVAPERVKEVSVGFNLVPALLSRRVDATLGAFWNYEGVQLEQQRRRPRIIRMEQAGVPTYNELVLVARRETVRERGEAIRAFVQALARGHEAARRDPDRGVDALIEANPDLERRHQLASVRATLPVFFPEDRDLPFGYQDPREWQAYARWMVDNRLVRRPPLIARALTNEFLAGEGVKK